VGLTGPPGAAWRAIRCGKMGKSKRLHAVHAHRIRCRDGGALPQIFLSRADTNKRPLLGGICGDAKLLRCLSPLAWADPFRPELAGRWVAGEQKMQAAPAPHRPIS
jgi:hypothetical protein